MLPGTVTSRSGSHRRSLRRLQDNDAKARVGECDRRDQALVARADDGDIDGFRHRISS